MKETKEQLIEKILIYMKKKGEIVDKLMAKYAAENDIDPIESFYTKEDEKALRELLTKQSETKIRACIDKIVDPKSFGKDVDICPFCSFFINNGCKGCPYGENHGICITKDSENSTYERVNKVTSNGIYGIKEIQDLIKNTF